jgi:hypothetical protein
MAYLEAHGVPKTDRSQLEAALKDDKGKLGPRVKAWLGELAVKAAASGGRIAEGAAGGLIAAGVLRYLGIA